MRKIKKLILSYLPGSLKNRLFWVWETIKYLRKNPWSKPRSRGDYQIAKDFFLNYHSLSKPEKERKVTSLTKGLDQESRELVDLVLERQKYIFTHDILGQKELFSASERKMQEIYYKEIGAVKRFFINYEFSAFYPESFIFLSGLRFLPESVQTRLHKGIFIDGGAFNGDSALSFCRNYGQATVYAFEPENNNYDNLIRNIKKCQNITPVNKGLGDGIIFKSKILDYGPASRINDGYQAKQEINLISLDQFVSEMKITNIDCIKLDLEGFEQTALKGMVESIKKWQPVLAISIYHNTQDFFSIKSFIEEMNLGYSFKIVKASPFSLAQEVVLLAYL